MQQVLTSHTGLGTCSLLGNSGTLVANPADTNADFDMKYDITQLFLGLTLAALEWFLFLRRWHMQSGSPLSA